MYVSFGQIVFVIKGIVDTLQITSVSYGLKSIELSV